MQRLDAEHRHLPHVRMRVGREAAEHEAEVDLALIDGRADAFRIRAGRTFQYDSSVVHFTANCAGHFGAERADIATAQSQVDRRAAIYADVVEHGEGDEQNAGRAD